MDVRWKTQLSRHRTLPFGCLRCLHRALEPTTLANVKMPTLSVLSDYQAISYKVYCWECLLPHSPFGSSKCRLMWSSSHSDFYTKARSLTRLQAYDRCRMPSHPVQV
ncbi:unnamed protein product [Ixodes pacificus]